jgi:hypothetical protein
MLTNLSLKEASDLVNKDLSIQNKFEKLHWTDYQDTNLIVNLLRGCSSILEIGTHYGYTTYNIARTLPLSYVTTIDIIREKHNKLPEFQKHELLSLYESGKECQSLENVNQIYYSSNEFFDKNREIFQGIFIDGSHDYEQVLVDSRNAKTRIKSGVIVWHDVYNKYTGIDSPKVSAEPNNPGVVLALKELNCSCYKIEDSWIAFTMV